MSTISALLSTSQVQLLDRVITKKIDFCAGHRLLNYSGKCKNVHGHNLQLEVAFSSRTLNQYGMVVDFSNIKDQVKQWVDDNLDHGFVANYRDGSMIKFLVDSNQKHFVLTPKNLGLEGLYSPEDIASRVELTNPTMENLALCIKYQVNDFAQLFSTLDHQVKVSNVRLYESDTGWCDV